MMRNKILLLGGFGLLGQDIYSTLIDQSADIIRYPKENLNLLNRERLDEVVQDIKPNIIINASGYTDVDEAEKQPTLAFDHNCTAVFNLATAIRHKNIRLIQISTDYVFDGAGQTPYSEEARRNPVNCYGLSKKISEDLVTGLNENHYLIRSSWLFGHHGHCFPKTIMRALQQGDSLKIVHDQIGSPTYTKDLANSIAFLINNPDIPFGTYHITNSGETDWHSFAIDIAKEAGLSMKLIVPVDSDLYLTAAKRPMYSVLDCSKWNAISNQPMDAYQNALKRFLSHK